MITKIKVVGEDGKPIDMNQALIRNLLRIIDGLFAYLIGAVLIWRSDKKQRLGDNIAKTVDCSGVAEAARALPGVVFATVPGGDPGGGGRVTEGR